MVLVVEEAARPPSTMSQEQVARLLADRRVQVDMPPQEAVEPLDRRALPVELVELEAMTPSRDSATAAAAAARARQEQAARAVRPSVVAEAVAAVKARPQAAQAVQAARASCASERCASVEPMTANHALGRHRERADHRCLRLQAEAA